MNGEWRTVRLGDVLTLQRRPVAIEDDRQYQQVTVRIRGRGLASRGVVAGSRIATKRQFEVSTGQLVTSKIDARNGGFGLVPPELDGAIVSGDFLAFEVDEASCLAEYLDLYVRRPSFWEECELVSEGSTNRVRLVPEQFLDLEVELPSLQEQRAIVESVATTDRAISAYERLAGAARRVHLRAREELIEAPDFDHVPLAELVTAIKGGKSPKCLDRPPRDGEYGVLKVSAIRDGEFRPEEAKALPEGVEPAAPSVGAGDLLYSRANTAALVGAMCRARQDYPRLLLCDKTMRVTVSADVVDPDYLIEAVGTSPAREHIEVMAGGTSESMKNISQDAYLQTEVALPSLHEQRRIATALGALRQSATAAHRHHQRLLRVRAAFVDELVGGERDAAGEQLAA